MFKIGDRVRLTPSFDEPSNPTGTVVRFDPSETSEDGHWVIVRCDTGKEAPFATGALRPAEDE